MNKVYRIDLLDKGMGGGSLEIQEREGSDKNLVREEEEG